MRAAIARNAHSARSPAAVRTAAYVRDRPMAPLPPPAVDRTAGGPPPPPPPPPPAPRGKSLFQALAFNAAPELINGRLACVFFLYAAVNSARTGLPFAAQLAGLTSGAAVDVGGIALAATIVVASLIPVMKGAVSEPFGPLFTPARELFHCRAAMLAFATVMALEAQAGVAFF